MALANTDRSEPKCVELPLTTTTSWEETSGDGSPQEEPFQDEEGSVPGNLQSLNSTLKILYALNGATMQLPSLALLAIVNDRVAIPPAFLPAYSAVSFLPHSLKPLYAALSIPTQKQHQQTYTSLLLAVMFTASGLAYAGTAVLIPPGGVFSCFVWGFLRGTTSAWSQFLLDQCLIRQAQQGDSYQALSSLFQSQAATHRHAGSLLASIAIFGVFAWRQFQKEREEGDPPLSDTVVMALLLGTALIQFGATLLVLIGLSGWKKSIWNLFCPDDNQQLSQPNHNISYDALATREDSDASQEDGFLSPSANTNSTLTTVDDCTLPEEEQPASETPPPRQRPIREYSDIASLVLLQALLIGAALKRPIAALPNGPAVWTPTMILLAICLVVGVLVSSCYSSGDENNGHRSSCQTTSSANIIPARLLGLYLILRHSVPIASILMYSYVYTLFGTKEPLFLQLLFIIESATSTVANWTYGKWIAPKYHSGWDIIQLIAVLSIAASLLSLLDVIIVHVANAKTAIDANLRWLVVGVSVLTYFMGQVGFMPSVVLSTANVVSSDRSPPPQHANAQEAEAVPHEEWQLDSDITNSTNEKDAQESAAEGYSSFYDEGIQYATFVACIDFGAQLGDWISVPIIAAYGITRDNNWANLDRYIVLCAMLRIASVTFLWLIRPQSSSSL